MAQDRPETLSALHAIRQNFKPLLAKRIQDDNKNVESLGLSNSRSLLKYELDLALDNSKNEQKLPLDDYPSPLHDYHRFFQLLEGLIDQQVLHPTTASLGPRTQNEPPAFSYPKLEAFLKQASEESSFDLSTLLRLPQTNDESKEVEQTLTDFNAKNFKGFNRDTHQDANFVDKSYQREVPESTATPELERLKQSQRCLANLWNALAENIRTSKCDFSHVAKLQIRDPPGSCESNAGVQHKIYISCCLSENKWQKTICHVFPQLSPSSQKLKHVRSICKAIRASILDEQTLELLVHSTGIHRSPNSPTLNEFPPRWPTLSLEDILSSQKVKFDLIDKVILGLNLSRALLRMYNSGIHSKDWTAENIFFLVDPRAESVCEAYHPYFAHSLLEVRRPDTAERDRPSKFSVLVAFAKLLCEIALGRRILGPFNRPLDIYLLALIYREVTNNMVKGYVNAVCYFLEANKRGSDYDDESDVEESDNDEESDEDEENDIEALDEENQGRMVLLTAIDYLEEALKMFKRPKDPNDSRTLKFSRSLSSQSIANSLSSSLNSQWNQAAPPDSSQDTVDAGPNQLFDMRENRFSAGDVSLSRAKSFLDLAEKFYNKHIQNLPNDRKIRIAILDTGINEADPYFQGVEQIRKNKDSPFKKMESFVDASADYSDTFGHGTNVAYLILKIAPDVDLYIAKISQKQKHNKGSDAIVKAIEWARRLNVDIINMSFALMSDEAAIKRAIENAEHEGVIIFAAASNYGGNTNRNFPAKMDKVLCLHASDGFGNKSGMDPSPEKLSVNLTTLGVAIPPMEKNGSYLSGTSYSTPVAVGVAANVLRFIEHVAAKGLLTLEQRNEAFSRSGMKKILLGMSEDRDEYQFIVPWKEMFHDDCSIGDIVSNIRRALKK